MIHHAISILQNLRGADALSSLIERTPTKLAHKFSNHTNRYLDQLSNYGKYTPEMDAAFACGQELTRVRYQLRRLAGRRLVDRVIILDTLKQQYEVLASLASSLTGEHTARPRAALAEGQRLICVALHELEDARYAPIEPHSPNSRLRSGIQIPTELLAQCMASLFPAERMGVIAGRQVGDELMLTAFFDVTGTGPGTNGGHVDADPQKLASALIAMDNCGSHLAAWVHSHPGRGPFATGPSSTDLRQFNVLRATYSDRLLALIVVADGFVRFWRTPKFSETPDIHLVGSGVEAVEGEEDVFWIQR